MLSKKFDDIENDSPESDKGRIVFKSFEELWHTDFASSDGAEYTFEFGEYIGAIKNLF